MSLRAQRLTQFLVAASLVGCCIKPPSSVDSVPGGWINLIEKGLPTGPVPGKGPADSPDEVPGLPKEAGDLPGQAEPSQPTRPPEPVPVTDPPPVTVQVEERKPSPDPVAQPGITPGTTTRDDTAPGPVSLPAKPPAGLGIPLPAQPAPSANLPTTPAVPTLGIFGRESPGSTKPAPALPLLNAAADSTKPSQGFSLLGDASESDRTTLGRSPSLGLSETPNTRDRGISPSLAVPAAPSAEPRQGLIRLTPATEPGSVDGTPRAPSLGLIDGNASSGAPKRVPKLADPAPPKAQVDSLSAVPQLSIPAQRPGVGAAGSAPLPSPEIQSPARAPVRSEGEASLRLPGLNTPAASVSKATSSNALRLSPTPATVPVAGINPPLPLPKTGPGTAAPLTVNESVKGTSVVPVTRSGSALTPPAVAEVPADSPVDSVILDKSSRALNDADAARRRIEVLREEMRGYEFEAEQLRALLRRVLGLDEPTSSPVIEPDPGAPVRLNDDGE